MEQYLLCGAVSGHYCFHPFVPAYLMAVGGVAGIGACSHKQQKTKQTTKIQKHKQQKKQQNKH